MIEEYDYVVVRHTPVDPDTRLFCDRSLFVRAMRHLLDNALKFSTPGTPIRLQLRREGQCSVLTVSDQGRGMKSEHIAEIGAYMQFERRFYEQQGSGLGLAIVKGLAAIRGDFEQIYALGFNLLSTPI